MNKEREELRRGIRSFIQDASVELAEFTSAAAPAVKEPRPEPKPAREPAPPDKPILRLVREAPVPEPAGPTLDEITLHLPKKGVCAAYFVNKRCWELPDAYCNHAPQICQLRDCPVYNLHRDDMENRYARKFKHLW